MAVLTGGPAPSSCYSSVSGPLWVTCCHNCPKSPSCNSAAPNCSEIRTILTPPVYETAFQPRSLASARQWPIQKQTKSYAHLQPSKISAYPPRRKDVMEFGSIFPLCTDTIPSKNRNPTHSARSLDRIYTLILRTWTAAVLWLRTFSMSGSGWSVTGLPFTSNILSPTFSWHSDPTRPTLWKTRAKTHMKFCMHLTSTKTH